MANNPLGSIFDTPQDYGTGGTVDPLPYDPLHGPLTSGMPWEKKVENADMPPHERPRDMYGGSLPATNEYLVCVDGPCKHYRERLEDADTAGERVMTRIIRSCSACIPEREMEESTCFACTEYMPPLVSLGGWRRWVIIQHRLNKARRKMAGRQELGIRESILEELYKMVKQADTPELPAD